jgi:cobalt-precorrin-5B (C1)-methyltransferase
VKALYGLPDGALIDMGDFVGGMLKHLRDHPVPRITIAGGVAKITKLAQGLLDLHSARGSVDLPALADMARKSGGSKELAGKVAGANTTAEAFDLALRDGISLGDAVAARAWETAAAVLAGSGAVLDIVIFDRDGNLAGRSEAKPVHAAPPKR